MTVDQLGARASGAYRRQSNIRISPIVFVHDGHRVGGIQDIRTLQELLGHTNISTTMQYVHPDMDRMRSLLETFFVLIVAR